MRRRPALIIAIGGFILMGLGFCGVRLITPKTVETPSLFSEKMLSLTPLVTPTPSPTPKPLTFAQMNALYGPCVVLPVLMYHHIQTPELARANNQVSLTVYSDIFSQQMTYLKTKGYLTVTPGDLISFFDASSPVPKKAIMLTFDDGYEDFYTNALLVLRSNGFSAVSFLPTGLVNNSGYLSWSQISEMAGGGIVFGNHTWSHKNSVQPYDVLLKEISTADIQLAERGLNTSKIFAYPYGASSADSEKVLSSLGYKLGFTTKGGSTQCKGLRFDLRRIRIGNIPLSSYGL